MTTSPCAFPSPSEQQAAFDHLRAAIAEALELYDQAVAFPRSSDAESFTADWREQRAVFRYLGEQLLRRISAHSFDVSSR